MVVARAFNEKTGTAVKARRRALGMSQARVAAAMTESGLPMRQQTILKIEQGSRSLRLDEGLAMAGILGVSVEAFRSPDVPTASTVLGPVENGGTFEEVVVAWFDRERRARCAPEAA